MNVKEFRAKYPGAYDDLSDQQIADQLYAKHYSDMDRNTFNQRFLGATAGTSTGTSKIASPPSPGGVPAIFNGMDPASQAANAGVTIAQMGGPLEAAAGIPKRALKEGGELVRGIGPLIGGALHAASLGPRLAAHDPSAPFEAAQAARAFGRALPAMGKALVEQTGQELQNPVGSFLERPLTTSMDALALADLPSLGLKATSNVSSRIPGAERIAMKAAEGAELSKPGAVLGRLSGAAEEAIPGYGAFREAGRQRMATRKLLAAEEKVGAANTEAFTKQRDIAAAGLRPSEFEAMTPIAMGTASMAPNPTRYPTLIERLLSDVPRGQDLLPVPANKAGMERYLDWRSGIQKANEAEAIARGQLTPDIAEVRRWQPLRIATGGPEQLKYEAAPRRAYNVTGLEKRAKEATKAAAGFQKKGALAAIKDSEAARLSSRFKQSATEEQAMLKAQREGAFASGKSAQAQKGLRPIEDMEAGPLRSRMVSQATDLTKAELAKEQAALGAQASKAAMVGKPTTLARKLGKTEQQLSEAQGYQRAAARKTAQAERLTAKADARRGVVPSFERLKRQTEATRFTLPNANPQYVPQLAKRGETVREIIGKTFKRSIKNETPGYAKQSIGARFAEGTMEPNLAKIDARHQKAVIDYATRERQLESVIRQPWAKKVESLKDFDWDKNALVDMDAFRRTGEGIDQVSEALKTTDPAGALAQAAQGAVKRKPVQFAGKELYAIPKAAAKEMEGQFKAGGPSHPLMQAIFDKPNDYLRMTALTLRPGFYVNNLVGNAAAAALSGATPSAVVRAVKGRESIPSMVKGSGFAAIEAPGASMTMGKLGRIGKIPHALNEAVDDIFRHASFKSEVDRLAMKKSILETGKRLEKNMTDAEKLAAIGPEGQRQALDHVNQFLNDYSIQAPWQKRVLRKVVPFQSFLVHMGKMVTRLPVNHPMRAEVLGKLSQLANEYQSDQFKEVGVEKPAPYRLNQLPVRKTDTGAITFGTGGMNPASGLGAMNSDIAVDQGVPQLLGSLADQAGPVPQYLADVIRKGKSYGAPYTKPGVRGEFGTNRFFDTRTGEEVGAPLPSGIDLIRSNTPLLQLLEAAAQPNETYDLVGSANPFDPNYLPSRFNPPRPRRYGLIERLLGYSGLPMRDFERSELEQRK